MSDKDDASVTTAESEDEDDSDLFENALEDVEIDQTSELYQTIAAAIIEESANRSESDAIFCDAKCESSDSNGWEEVETEK